MSQATKPSGGGSPWEKAMLGVAWVALLFSATVALAIAVTTLHARRYDPLTTNILEDKLLALNRDPKNVSLRSEVRRLDLEVRQTYFRRQAFATNGFYLVLSGVAVFLLANEIRKATRRSVPFPNPRAQELEARSGPGSRMSVVLLSVLLGGGLATLAAMSRHDAAAEYAREAVRPAEKRIARPEIPESPSPVQGGTALQPLPPPALSGPIAPAEPTVGGVLTATTVEETRLEPASAASAGSAPRSTAKAASLPIEAVIAEGLENDWPSFRGPSGVGLAPSAKPMTDWSATENVLWKAAVDLPGWNSPIVVGDKVFLTGADKAKRAAYCFNAVNGDLVWRRELASTTKEVPQVLDDTGYAPSTMASDGRRVFAIFPNGDIFALDLAGRPLWQKSLGIPENAYGHAASLAVFGNGLIVQFDQGTSPEEGKSKLIALDCATGKTVWEVPRPVAGSWSTPIVVKVGGKEQIVTVASPFAIAYEASTGKELWRAECLSGDVAPSPAFGSGYLFAANLGSNLTALRPDLRGDITKTGVGWTYQDDLPDIASLLCKDGYLYLLATEGVLTCLEAKTGKKLWSHNYNARFNASPIHADGKVYVFEIGGKAHILQAGGAFKEIASPSIGEEVRATPAFVSDRIYIRGKQHLFCIGGL